MATETPGAEGETVTDLVVILISGEELTQNLARSLAEPETHPWAFGDWKRQMQAVKVGTEVAFIDLVDEGGRQVNRFTSNTAVLAAKRIVMGRVSRNIEQTEQAFFPGYPYEFSFDQVTDEELAATLSLPETVEWLNARVDGLDLEPVQLHELVKHAKSNKIGVFIDGAPRKANYFRDAGQPPGSAGGDLSDESGAGFLMTDEMDDGPRSEFDAAVSSFSDAVAAADLVFLGANSHLPKAFLAAVVAKRFAILSGLSGSGKTQLARSLGQWLGEDEKGPRYLVVPVRPDWTSPEPLLGYEDALLKPDGGRRAWTAPSPLRFMLRAAADPQHLYLLVLDEMNLAHVERYFADVLSGIESGERVLPALLEEADGHWRIPDGQGLLALPANLLVVGTVNVDETTYQFSPKVLDRAFTFDFRVSTSELGQASRRPGAVTSAADEELSEIRKVLLDDGWHLDHPAPRLAEVVEQLTDLHERLSEIGFEFGHRTFYEATRFAATLAGAGLAESDEALDWILMTKILPRLHGSRRQLEPFLGDLLAIATGDDAEKPVMPRTARKAARMLELVRANQFVSFAE
jgi:5-methylcytosine-specific restriction protein B